MKQEEKALKFKESQAIGASTGVQAMETELYVQGWVILGLATQCE
jgi:hypothetical protein